MKQMRGGAQVHCGGSSSAQWFVAALLLLLVLSGSSNAEGAVSCDDAVSALIPCGAYLIGQGGADPTPRCCESAQALNRLAATAAARRRLCECLKETGPSFGVVPQRAQRLPAFCKLKLSIPVSPTVDCNRVAWDEGEMEVLGKPAA